MGSKTDERGQTIDLTSLSAQQLLQVKKQLDDELEHLNSSFTKLHTAQAKFGECLKSIDLGVPSENKGKPILVPLTTSLYVPGTITCTESVIVDVGTGFYVEKSTAGAKEFYNGKVHELGTNLNDLERIIQGKASNLRVIEDVLRQKVSESSAKPEVTTI